MIIEQLKEQLYLIELLVDTVNVYNVCVPDCTCQSDEHEALQVRIKFSDFPCLDINQDEFGNHDRRGDFSGGKSYLFPMAPLDLVRTFYYYPLAITVIKGADVVGVCRIAMPPVMTQAVRRAMKCCAQQQSESFKGTFPLVTLDGEAAGEIALFTRLTCFGQSVTTEYRPKESAYQHSTEDSSPICITCQVSDPKDPSTLDVRNIKPLLSRMEDCCGDNTHDASVCTCPIIPKPPVTWQFESPCQCDLPCSPQRSMLRYIAKVMAQEAAENAPKNEIDIPDLEESEISIDIVLEEPDVNPPVRYNTTGALSPAADGAEPSPRKERLPPPNPPVRFDTTGALSPASGGQLPPAGTLLPTPEVRYDNTGALSPEAFNPPTRYDTTGQLSRAYQGQSDVPPDDSRLPKLPGESSTGAIKHVQLKSKVSGKQPSEVQVEQSKNKSEEKNKAEEKAKAEEKNKAPANPVEEAKTGTEGKKKKKRKAKKQVGDHPARLHMFIHQIDMVNRDKVNKEISGRRVEFEPNYKYVYWRGHRYPPLGPNHKNCVERRMRVPGFSGWLWNTGLDEYGLKFRFGWRPGAIGKSLRDVIRAVPAAVPPSPEPTHPHHQQHHTQQQPQQPAQQRVPWRKSVPADIGKAPVCVSKEMEQSSEDDARLPPPPTLRITRRREGDLDVYMHPKNIGSKGEQVPLHFRIPSKPKAVEEEPSSSESELDIQLFAPGTFVPRHPRRQLVSTEVQYFDGDYLPPPPMPEVVDTKSRKKGGKQQEEAGAGPKLNWDQDPQATGVASTRPSKK